MGAENPCAGEIQINVRNMIPLAAILVIPMRNAEYHISYGEITSLYLGSKAGRRKEPLA